ncbi:MAG: tRNA 2-thiouridine(34) synthase MnmA [Patescibacteria group bacterium]
MKKINNSTKVIVGLSGGVDSAAAAYLLKKQGYDVHAVFMKNFAERVGPGHECPWREDRLMAYRVATHLGIPVETWNFENEYHAKVLRYMVTEYQRGRTPNPDIMCNKEIKFKLFTQKAKRSGAQLIATGHYARISKDTRGVYHLHKGKDANKDQSYFLAALDQSQLRSVLFPVGSMTKPRVRALARRLKLPNADRPDSQGICFVGKVPMDAFLKRYIEPQKGDIVDTRGSIVGTHDGVSYYTIGQRRGINIGGGPALYVVGKDSKRNRLVVGVHDDLALLRREITVRDWHWLGGSHRFPLACTAKIRYRQANQRVTLRKTGKTIMASFAVSQRAVSAGQTLAAYRGSELVGSGIID